MTGTIELVVGLMLAVAALALLARKFQIPYPILFVIGGLLLGLVPKLPPLHLEPELIFVLFLPPLLYPAGLFTPWRDFRENIRPILALALGLVLFTTVVVAWFAHQFLGLSWAVGFVLGAIISPPDAVAATAITRTLRVPRRIVAIIDGESLANDATSFTTYRFAIAAVVTGAFSLSHATINFVVVVIGGILVGLAVGTIAASIHRRLDDPPVQTTMSLLTPYATYLAAESLHVSGIIGVVVAGLFLGWRSPETLTARTRLVVQNVWQMVVFILNGFLFILIGLQLRDVIRDLSGHSVRQAVWYAALIVALVILVRIVWVFVVTYAPRGIIPKRHFRPKLPPWKNVAIVSWAGMRGVDSLAAALAIPFLTKDGTPFPERGLIIFVTFCVIFGTLVLQGLSLAPIIRWLKLSDDHTLQDEERHARLHANRAALEKISQHARKRKIPEHLVDRLRAEYEDRIHQLTTQENETEDGHLTLYSPEYEELSKEALAEERNAIVALRNQHVINDHVLRRIQKDIDLAETRLQKEEGGFEL
jgi:CPA1 family monovalent cation:H+ antiporter